MSVDAFFAYARERHATHLRRSSGRPRSEWTSDPILRQYRFCNIFRELDRTTIWYRENVRERFADKPELLLATVLFRWFNRIAAGEAIFQQCRSNFVENAVPGETAWDELIRTGSTAGIRDSMICWCGEGPYVTGSYIIKTPDGKSKLDGVLWCVEQFMTAKNVWIHGAGNTFGWRPTAQELLEWRDTNPFRLQDVWAWLRQFPFLGDFMAYEIVTDLRHTALLDRAPDIMTWANPGPGAMRGLNRIVGRRLQEKIPKDLANKEMRALLQVSLNCHYWPNIVSAGPHSVPGDLSDWPAWEMREVEHTLCEFDKYERARLGEGRPRQVFR